MSSLDDQLDEAQRLAWEAFHTGWHPAVIELMGAYLEHRPGNGLAWYLLGDALLGIGLIAESERALLRAVELHPTQWSFHTRLGALYKQSGDFAEAERWFAKACDNPEAAKKGWIWICRGAALVQHNQLREAEACHRRAMQLDEVDLDEAQLNLGFVLRAQGRYAEATEAFREAVRLDPSETNKTALDSMAGLDAAMRLANSIRDGGPSANPES